MELGNIAFGNSRGEYPIDRDVGFEEELQRLFKACVFKKEYSEWNRSYGVEFENSIFSVFPYYWGNCSCGFDDHEFKEGHINCIQNEYDEYGDDLFENDKKYEITKKLYQKRGWDTKSKKWYYGCLSSCDCDYNERYQRWLNSISYPEGHKKDCLLLKPNFLYKPTGLKIQWYKYPLRDSYSNQEIKLGDFKKIIDECINSVIKGGQENAYYRWNRS